MAQNFTSYAEAQAWIAERQAIVGKRAFTASAEYHAAYPLIQKLHAAEGHKRHRRGKNTKGVSGSLLAWSLHNA